ncbi:MAG: glutamine amidotransferase [Alphaproteobacteria bacterium]|nr:glutamine amidotransferase [Alphaproteobacteria bacterium]
MKNALVFRHVHFEDLGCFQKPLQDAGYGIRYVDVGLDDLDEKTALAADLLVVLGGPIGAYEENLYPFLKPELAVLRQRLVARKPTLGICLGAQLMALALGSDVKPGKAKEIGWAPMQVSEEGKRGVLAALDGVAILHWHGDVFDLPSGAVRLASTEICANQAFAIGDYALGFQGHPEADGRGFERWLIGHACEISQVKGLSVPALRADAKKYGSAAGAAGQKCLQEWLEKLTF